MSLSVVVIRDHELEHRGFGGIFGVGKGAKNPPALAVLSHNPMGATQTIAWVGKGIVYDTGGLSLKGKVFFILFLYQIMKVIVIYFITDCHAWYEEGLWWCRRYIRRILRSCEMWLFPKITCSFLFS